MPSPSLETQPGGDGVDRLVRGVYDQLRVIAARYFRRERPGSTLQPTAIVHEAYLRLSRQSGYHWSSRSEFAAVASKMIRRVLVDHARRQRAQRRPDRSRRLSIEQIEPWSQEPRLDLLILDDALARLERQDARKARVVQLRFFGGLTVEEIAGVLGVSPRTVAQDWTLARAWLRRETEQLG